MTDALRVGVIGVGAIAQIAHLPALASRDDVELVGVCDIDIPKARSLATRFGVQDTFEDIEELLRLAKPDVVAICAPNHLHEIHVTTALSAGAAVLCERPLALDVAGVERVIAAQQRAGRPVLVGMNHRYRSDVQAVRKFAQGGELGTLRAIRAGWYQFRPSRAALGWRQRPDQSGGGVVLDLGLSLLDLGHWVADQARPVEAMASLHTAAGAQVEDAGCALVRCEGGPSIFIDVAWRYIGEQERYWIDVVGEKGSARLSPLKVYKELNGAPTNVTPTGAAGHESPFSASYRAEWATVLAAARGKVEPPALESQVVLHRTIDAIYRSAREGRAVTV